jgi:hypothetical protein
MRAARSVLLRTIGVTAAVIAILTIAGAVYAAWGGHPAQSSVAGALFIGGAVLVIVTGISGGGARGRRYDQIVDGGGGRLVRPPDSPLGWFVVGLLVIGAGVLVVAL